MQVSSLFCRPLRLCPGTTVFLMPMMGIFWKLPLKGTEFRDHLQGRAGWSCKGCVQFETGECVWHQISEREILTLGTQILELELRTNQLYLFLSPFLFFSVLPCPPGCNQTYFMDYLVSENHEQAGIKSPIIQKQLGQSLQRTCPHTYTP